MREHVPGGMGRRRLRGAAWGLAMCGAASAAAAQQDATGDRVAAVFASQRDGTTLTQVMEKLELMRQADPRPRADVAFGLGASNALLALEGLARGAYDYGLGGPMLAANMGVGNTPLGRIQNPKPMQVSAAKLRQGGRAFVQRWAAAARWCDEVERSQEASFVCEIDLRWIRLDIDGDGVAAEHEGLIAFLADVGQPNLAADLRVGFDRADARWLLGYSHFMRGIMEFTLALDWDEWFRRTGHVLFTNTDSDLLFLRSNAIDMDGAFIDDDAPMDVLDLIAMFAGLDFAVRDRAGLERARRHFVEVTRCSRDMWRMVEEETDDQREWIPSATQRAAMTGEPLAPEVSASWIGLMEEAEAVFEGRKLVPMWRKVPEGTGLNLRKAMTGMDRMDVFYWVQGSSAAPFIEKGDVATREVWSALTQPMSGKLFSFAFWFN